MLLLLVIFIILMSIPFFNVLIRLLIVCLGLWIAYILIQTFVFPTAQQRQEAVWDAAEDACKSEDTWQNPSGYDWNTHKCLSGSAYMNQLQAWDNEEDSCNEDPKAEWNPLTDQCVSNSSGN